MDKQSACASAHQTNQLSIFSLKKAKNKGKKSQIV